MASLGEETRTSCRGPSNHNAIALIFPHKAMLGLFGKARLLDTLTCRPGSPRITGRVVHQRRGVVRARGERSPARPMPTVPLSGYSKPPRVRRSERRARGHRSRAAAWRMSALIPERARAAGGVRPRRCSVRRSGLEGVAAAPRALGAQARVQVRVAAEAARYSGQPPTLHAGGARRSVGDPGRGGHDPDARREALALAVLGLFAHAAGVVRAADAAEQAAHTVAAPVAAAGDARGERGALGEFGGRRVGARRDQRSSAPLRVASADA